MMIGVPKEIKNNEFRVGLTPSGVRILTEAGHEIYIEKDAGEGSGISDEEYIEAGATLLPLASDVFEQTEMIVKVKEPMPEEYELIRENQIIFTYLHLAPAPELTEALIKSKCVAVAYETIQLEDGSLPLLTPMSMIAGRIAPQIGAHYLEKVHGGRGVLLGGVPGVGRGKVTILGGGVVGMNAARIAVGLGAEVYVLDIDYKQLSYLDTIFGNSLTTVMCNEENISRLIDSSDLVIGAVLIPGAKAPALVSKDMISTMLPGSVAIDVCIDQGGCFETSKPTTHEEPVYMVEGVVHYCVTNMPGAVGRTSTFALTNATLPYVLEIANLGCEEALNRNGSLAKGLNLFNGEVICKPVADSLGLVCTPIEAVI
ncbi:MAG: alanine dehydrogenase [Deltaproteobacteria bacterium]|nr:alanine dehydrogenase [Deltaproteobacteria bacterium]